MLDLNETHLEWLHWNIPRMSMDNGVWCQDHTPYFAFDLVQSEEHDNPEMEVKLKNHLESFDVAYSTLIHKYNSKTIITCLS